VTVSEAEQLAKNTLSEKRFIHTINVKKMAVKLAKMNGVSEEKAAIAALLHDIAKEMPKDKLLQILEDNAIIAENAKNEAPAVWHGVCAAILAKNIYGVDDEDILSAIKFHTIGKKNMSALDKIIYMADMVCEERDYPEVETLR